MLIDGIEYPVKLKFIGESDELMMLNGKIYNARHSQKGWFGVIDETGEEYAYPPACFEIIEEEYSDIETAEIFKFLREKLQSGMAPREITQALDSVELYLTQQ